MTAPGKPARGRAPSKRRKKRSKAPAETLPPKPRAPSRRAVGGALLRAASLCAGAVLVAATVWLFVVFPSERGPGDGRAVDVVVREHEGPDDLAADLVAAGLIGHPRLFAFWVRATGGTGAVAAGGHLLTDDASPRELMARLERRGSGRTTRVTFPEGWTRFDMARRLNDKHVVAVRAFLDATTDAALLRELGIEGESAEGVLFPATYDLPMDSDPREVVRRMKREFDRRWDTLARLHASTLTDVMATANLTVGGVVTLGSMVEKEAAVDEERALIASVFLNRLRDPAFHPRRLECDPTASYGCVVAPEKAASCASFAGKATAAIEHDPDNPYSTYTHEGLPPGPIANPGARSLEAVMAPATSRFFFFVAKGDGRHTFSETYAAHGDAVSGLRRSAEGKAARKTDRAGDP